MDRAILLAILDQFAGGPVGVETLAALLGEERDTIEDVYEPFLVQSGLPRAHPARTHGDAALLGLLRPRAAGGLASGPAAIGRACPRSAAR